MRRSDVQFKAKADTALFDEAPAVKTADVAIIPPGWLELPEPEVFIGQQLAYPYDGQPVWLTPDGVEAHPATWRHTRAYDAINVKWVYNAYWARHNAGGQKIDFEPLGYKKMED